MTTTLPQLQLSRIDVTQLPEVITVLNEAAARLAARGIEQWPADFHQDGGKRIKALEERVGWGEVYLLREFISGAVLGTVCLSQRADPDFAHGWPTPAEDGLYVYRMAAADRARGLGVGSIMLDRARAWAWFHGKRFVRLDCSKTNTALHQYYESQGFERVATVDAPWRKSGALFQIPASV